MGTVTVTVYDAVTNAPVAAMPVVFQNADSSLVAMATTDLQGTAAATMAAGGSVTAQQPTPQGYAGDRIYTFLAVKPGDHLLVGKPASASPATFITTFILPTVSNGYSYSVSTKCGEGGALSPSVAATLSCTTVDVYARVVDMNFNTIAALYKPNVAVSANATIDLSAETMHGMKSVTLTFDNLPLDIDNANYVSFDPVPPADNESLVQTMTLTTVGSVKRGTATFSVPDVSTIDWLATLSVYRPSPCEQSLGMRVPGASNATIDVGPKLLPWFTQDVGFSAPGHKLTWTETSGAATDYARMTLFVLSADSTRRYQWDIAGPAQPGALVLPLFAGAFATYNFQSTDNVAPDRVYLRRVPAGWDSVRSCAFDFDCFYQPLSQGEYATATGPNGISP